MSRPPGEPGWRGERPTCQLKLRPIHLQPQLALIWWRDKRLPSSTPHGFCTPRPEPRPRVMVYSRSTMSPPPASAAMS